MSEGEFFDSELVQELRVECDRHATSPHVVTLTRTVLASGGVLTDWAPARSTQTRRASFSWQWIAPDGRVLPAGVLPDGVAPHERREQLEVRCRQCRGTGRWRMDRLAPVLTTLISAGVGLVSLDGLNRRYANRS